MVKLRIENQILLKDESLQQLMQLLNKYGKARIVGGFVRDCLLNRQTEDVDIATTLEPAEVKDLLPLINAKAAPRREDHGSVLVVLNHQSFDVTTLRKDVQTTGRHAKVSYTKDWLEDAQRRDFTVNALYCDLDGTVHAPLKSSIEDLQARRLRFIGNLEQRVQEDYLRILRYFRFLAQLNWSPNSETVDALGKFVPELTVLSKERVYEEFKKLLSIEAAAYLTPHMDRIGIFQTLFKARAAPDVFKKACQRNPRLSTIGRFIAICPETIQLFLKKDDRKAAEIVLQESRKESSSYPHLIYFHGHEIAMTVATLRNEIPRYKKDTERMLDADFPIKSRDIPLEGPLLGKALRDIKDWWITHYCEPSKQDCLNWFKFTRNKL